MPSKAQNTPYSVQEIRLADSTEYIFVRGGNPLHYLSNRSDMRTATSEYAGSIVLDARHILDLLHFLAELSQRNANNFLILLSKTRCLRSRMKHCRSSFSRLQSPIEYVKEGGRSSSIGQSCSLCGGVISQLQSALKLYPTARRLCYWTTTTCARFVGPENATTCYCWHMCRRSLSESSSTSDSINPWSAHQSGLNNARRNCSQMRGRRTFHHP